MDSLFKLLSHDIRWYPNDWEAQNVYDKIIHRIHTIIITKTMQSCWTGGNFCIHNNITYRTLFIKIIRNGVYVNRICCFKQLNSLYI